MSLVITNITLVDNTGDQSDAGISYLQKWHVYFTGPFDVPPILYGTATAGGLTLPKKNYTHPSDAQAYVADVKVRLAADSDPLGTAGVPGIAEYDVTYGQKSISFDPNPLNRPAVVTGVGGLGIMEVPIKDLDDKPMVNSAGRLYSKLPERPIRGCRFTITRNEAINPATNGTVYSNSTNSAPWYGVASNNAAIGEIAWGPKNEVVNGTNLAYFEVTYPISCRRDGWRFKPLDKGYAVKVDSVSTPRRHVDDVGQAHAEETLLNGFGKALPPTNTTGVIFPTAGYKVDDELDWSTLSLPNPFA